MVGFADHFRSFGSPLATEEYEREPPGRPAKRDEAARSADQTQRQGVGWSLLRSDTLSLCR